MDALMDKGEFAAIAVLTAQLPLSSRIIRLNTFVFIISFF